MRALVQRVSHAEVRIAGETVGSCGKGMLVLIGISREDGLDEVAAMAGKLLRLRIFEDAAGKMNRSVVEIEGGILLVSQFTLYGDVRKGNRPGFDRAALPVHAESLYDALAARLAESGRPVGTGRFRSHMEVSLVNDGPVTILVDIPAEPMERALPT